MMKSEQSGPTGVPPRPLKGRCVLVVDDYPDSLRLFTLLLERAGARVVTASSAPEALALLETEAVDALVADLAMPSYDGLWLIERVRALPEGRGARLPAVAVTAHGEQFEQHARKAGFQAYLSKPVDSRELISHVVSLVEARDNA